MRRKLQERRTPLDPRLSPFRLESLIFACTHGGMRGFRRGEHKQTQKKGTHQQTQKRRTCARKNRRRKGEEIQAEVGLPLAASGEKSSSANGAGSPVWRALLTTPSSAEKDTSERNNFSAGAAFVSSRRVWFVCLTLHDAGGGEVAARLSCGMHVGCTTTLQSPCNSKQLTRSDFLAKENGELAAPADRRGRRKVSV